MSASEVAKIVSAEVVINAPAARIFELIADPARQPEWDGNDNLQQAQPGQRVHALGDIFTMTLTIDSVRWNHVVEFEEGRRIAWRPSEPDQPPPGHLWRWQLIPLDPHRTLVRHTYDWTELTDPGRFERARKTTGARLMRSLERLGAASETAHSGPDATEAAADSAANGPTKTAGPNAL